MRYLPKLILSLVLAGAAYAQVFPTPGGHTAHSGGGGASFVKATNFANASFGDSSATGAATWTTGNDLVFFCYSDPNPTASHATVSGLTGTEDFFENDGVGDVQTILHVHNVAGTGGTVGCAYSGSQQGIKVYILEFSGLDTTQKCGQTGASAGNFSTAVNSGTVTTTGSSCTLIGALMTQDGGADAWTLGSGWIAPTNGFCQNAGTCSMVSAAAYKLNQSAGSPSFTGTLAANVRWVGSIFAYGAP